MSREVRMKKVTKFTHGRNMEDVTSNGRSSMKTRLSSTRPVNTSETSA